MFMGLFFMRWNEKNEESFNHFKCITRYYIYTDIQWKGVWCVLSDDELVEQILLGNEKAAEDFLNAS